MPGQSAPFCRWQSQYEMYFYRKIYFDSNHTHVCSCVSSKIDIIGSGYYGICLNSVLATLWLLTMHILVGVIYVPLSVRTYVLWYWNTIEMIWCHFNLKVLSKHYSNSHYKDKRLILIMGFVLPERWSLSAVTFFFLCRFDIEKRLLTKCQSDTIIYSINLTASRHHETLQ